MLWFFLSLITALSVAVRDISIKALFTDQEPMEIAALELFWALPLLAVACFFVPIPELDTTFWWTFLISLPLNGLAYILYMIAIRASPISLTVPLLAFTPVFMILTGFFILDETITFWGGLGIGSIVMGSYILNLDRVKHGMLTPFSALLKEKGPRLMLIVAFLFSFAAVIGKKAMLHSSPLFFSYFFFLVFNTTILTALFLSGRVNGLRFTRERKKGMLLGGLLLMHVSCHAVAIALATAVYMVAVKRSSILFSVLLSWLVLREGHMAFRGPGTLCMFFGVLLITFLG
jgi:drug/metabolite transporter (DMT)-like permease